MNFIAAGDSGANRYFMFEASRRHILERLRRQSRGQDLRPSVQVKWGGRVRFSSRRAFVFNLLSDDSDVAQMRIGGRPASVIPFPDAAICLIDLMLDPAARVRVNDDPVTCYLPRTAFDRLGSEFAANLTFDLGRGDGTAVADAILGKLRKCLEDLVSGGHHSSGLMLDHLAAAAYVHIILNYSQAEVRSPAREAGLAPWQLRRAKEFFGGRLGNEIVLEEVAAACNLSRSHFSRAFRRSTGLPPHQWILMSRVERAKALLADPSRSLAEIAAACGFADQSHLTRVFSRIEGKTPGAWRRLQAERSREAEMLGF